MRTISARLWLLAALSGVLQVLPFPIAGPAPLWRRVFCWFCLTPLLWALANQKELGAKRAAAVAYLSGVIFYLGNCYWIYPTMHIYGNIPSIASIGILILFAMYVGLYHALFGAAFGWLRERASLGVTLMAAPFLWVAVELARARITGFPWDLLGYSQIDNLSLTRIAPVMGVMGISLVVAVVNVLWIVRWKRWVGPSLAAVCVLLVAAMQPLTRAELRPQGHAVLVQDNISVGAEGGPRETRDELLASLEQIAERKAAGVPTTNRLILLPEAPTEFIDSDPVFRQSLGELALKEHAAVIADNASVISNGPGKLPTFYGSASFFAADGSYQGRYDKMHLVPFGEYVPYRKIFFFAGHLLDNVGPFSPGTVRTTFHTGGHNYGVFICYESIFGDEIRELAKNGADVLVNLSDDGWYGDSSAPWEHLDMVRMRAIENDRWVLRSTNTGITTAIDPYGRVGETLPRHVRDALVAGFGYETKVTFYTEHGDWVGWVCVLFGAGVLVVVRLRSGKLEAAK